MAYVSFLGFEDIYDVYAMFARNDKSFINLSFMKLLLLDVIYDLNNILFDSAYTSFLVTTETSASCMVTLSLCSSPEILFPS